MDLQDQVIYIGVVWYKKDFDNVYRTLPNAICLDSIEKVFWRKFSSIINNYFFLHWKEWEKFDKIYDRAICSIIHKNNLLPNKDTTWK